MTERPIIFSAPMVLALLAGTKSQTRRVMKPQFQRAASIESNDGYPGEWVQWIDGEPYPSFHCPYGIPGDRLWCREAWNYIHDLTAAEQAKRTHVIRQFQAGEVTDIVEAAMSLPVASGEKRAMYAADFGEWAHNPDSDLRWLSPIFMPRWASRITLEITDVRVERVQDIRTADADAEGISTDGVTDRVEEYARLWDSINGKRAPWTSNPWVWVIEFLRV